MRSDIVPEAIFPDYELSDHTAKRRKLSELQGQHPMVLVLGREYMPQRTAARLKGLFNFIVSSRLPIANSSRSAPIISLRRVNMGAEKSVLTGRSFRTRSALCKKISTSPNTPTQSTIQWFPMRLCWSLALSYTRSTTATGSSAARLWKICVRTYVPSPKDAARTGISQRPNSRRRGNKAARNFSIRMARRTSKLSVSRIRRGIASDRLVIESSIVRCALSGSRHRMTAMDPEAEARPWRACRSAHIVRLTEFPPEGGDIRRDARLVLVADEGALR